MVEKSLWKELLLELFLKVAEQIIYRKIMVFLVKNVGLEILDPTLTSQRNWTCMVCGTQAPCCGLMRPCQVLLQVPRTIPERRQDGDTDPESTGGGKGSLRRS